MSQLGNYLGYLIIALISGYLWYINLEYLVIGISVYIILTRASNQHEER